MSYMQEYEKWLASPALSEQEHAELESIRDDEKEIRERFYGPLEFGTAGLRGTMKVGLHQMNIHVIRWATQGFARRPRAGAWPCAWTAATTLWSLPEPPQRSAPPTASMCVSSSRCGPRRS